MLWTAVGDEWSHSSLVDVFPGKGNCLVTILEQGHLNPELRADTSWIHLTASSVRVRHSYGKHPSARNRVQVSRWESQVEQLKLQPQNQNSESAWTSVEVKMHVFGGYPLPQGNSSPGLLGSVNKVMDLSTLFFYQWQQRHTLKSTLFLLWFLFLFFLSLFVLVLIWVWTLFLFCYCCFFLFLFLFHPSFFVSCLLH